MKVQNNLESRNYTAVPAIEGDGIAYGVACLQFVDPILEVQHFVEGIFDWIINLVIGLLQFPGYKWQ
jgi:hypothetical protein